MKDRQGDRERSYVGFGISLTLTSLLKHVLEALCQ